jgi:isoleucyl-tRNA synthetase
VDRWVLSRLQSVEAEAAAAWEEYAVHDALETVLSFLVEDVSRFYVKAIRSRMWEEAESASKRGAYATLATVLDECVRMLAPYVPYLSERIYQRLDGAATTVHALSWPEPDDDLRDERLEANVAVLRRVEEAAANARQQGGRKLRWPVPRVVVESDDPAVREAVAALSDLLSERVNAREVRVVERFDELVERAEPRMDEIGPAFGADAQRVMDAVEGTRREELAVEGDGFRVVVDGETFDLPPEMVTFVAEPPEHVAGADFDGGAVYVDTSLTEAIEAEGYARDVVRRVQEMRSRLDLAVDERIRTGLAVGDDRVAALVDDRREFIAGETRTDEFVDVDEVAGLTEEWEIEGVPVTIAIERVSPEQRAA